MWYKTLRLWSYPELQHTEYYLTSSDHHNNLQVEGTGHHSFQRKKNISEWWTIPTGLGRTSSSKKATLPMECPPMEYTFCSNACMCLAHFVISHKSRSHWLYCTMERSDWHLKTVIYWNKECPLLIKNTALIKSAEQCM